MRRTRRRRDKEQLVDLRGLQEVLGVSGFALVHDGGWFAKVDLSAHMGPVVEERLTVQHLADGDGMVDLVKGADDAAE